jgi:hypothetical protein
VVPPPTATRRASARPFVGRVQELTDLAAALDDATEGRGSLHLVTGEPGIGKTRLMSELAQVATEKGARVVTGRCWEEGGAPPYWPWMQVVRSAGGEFEALAGRREGARPVVPGGDRIRLFDAVGRFLADAAEDRPLLVTLDDVHAARSSPATRPSGPVSAGRRSSATTSSTRRSTPRPGSPPTRG